MALYNVLQDELQTPMRKLYTECDLRRVGHDGSLSCSSRVVQLSPNISAAPSPAVTDALVAAVPPPDYGSFAPHQLENAASAAADDMHADDRCSALMTAETMSLEMPPSSGAASACRWRWNQWRRRWKAWVSLDALTLADSIDQFSRVGFPLLFTVLSVAYWAIYLHIRPAEYDDDFVTVD